MTVLITGGAGYIGSHICLELLNLKINIVVLDNFSNSTNYSLERVKEITGREFKVYHVDLVNRDEVKQVFQENNIRSVIHLASLKSVGKSTTDPLLYYKNNVLGTIVLCEVMSEFNVKEFVFSSSAAVYGNSKQVPIKEDAPLQPINPYGQTKMLIEILLTDIVAADPTWRVTILRYFNPVGAHKSGLIGDLSQTNLITRIYEVAIKNQSHINIYGDDYPTKDGTGVRDYLHVMDLAEGHIKALNKVKSNDGLEVYNLGSGKGYTVLEMIGASSEVVGKKINYHIVKRRLGDVAKSYACTKKAKQALGWEAHKGLKQMCVDAWRWHQKNESH